MKNILLLFTVLILKLEMSFASKIIEPEKPKIEYFLSMPEPHTHYFEVSMTVENSDKSKDYTDFKMPVWTPGSYLIREYAKNVEGFSANDGTNALKFDKINKNTWRVFGKNNKITIKYKVYSFELTVRTSFLDDVHGYVNGASLFMYVPELKMSALNLTVIPKNEWKTVSTGMKRISKKDFQYFASDFDVLVDSPIEIGNHKVLTFKTLGILHTLAIFTYAPYNFDEEKVIDAFKKVTYAASEVIGEHPCEDYTFIIHQIPNPGGGLEHSNSTTCQVNINAFANETAIKNAMGLFAHEYFHLWNVKRIRPIALGPFDYENENYSHCLWVSEGITSYYQWEILLRAGVLTPEEYLLKLEANITGVENQPGQKVQSVAEASWDAWIKNYRPNENSANSTISYYSKGALIGSLINLYILGETNGKKNLDDVFKLLWNEYYKKQNRGFKDEEFQKACELISGKNMEDFFQKYVWGTEQINYNNFYNYVGLKLDKENDKTTAFLGATIVNGKISNVLKGSSAYDGGLNVFDEILEINDVSVQYANGAILDKKVGEIIKVKVRRSGQEYIINIPLKQNPSSKFHLEKMQVETKEQKVLYKKWLYIK